MDARYDERFISALRAEVGVVVVAVLVVMIWRPTRGLLRNRVAVLGTKALVARKDRDKNVMVTILVMNAMVGRGAER